MCLDNIKERVMPKHLSDLSIQAKLQQAWNLGPREVSGNLPVTSVVQAFHSVHLNFLFLILFSLTYSLQLSSYAWIPVVELKLAMFLIHILHKKQYTLFPNVCAGTKIPDHNPMATDF